MEVILSSNRTIPDAYLAVYVPSIPIDKPTFAFLSRYESPVPSPVIATLYYNFLKPAISKYLS